MAISVRSLQHEEKDPTTVKHITNKKAINFGSYVTGFVELHFSSGFSSLTSTGQGINDANFSFPTRDLSYSLLANAGQRSDQLNGWHEVAYVSYTSPLLTTGLTIHTRLNAYNNNNTYPFRFVWVAMAYAGWD